MTASPLNREQERAAATLEGPVIITAGAGTGKTRALTERFARAVTPEAAPGWASASVTELLTITFTEKAAGEIAERVRVALRAQGLVREARELDVAWISTIHGLCARILRRHALEAGLDPSFSVADEMMAAEIAEEAFDRVSSGEYAISDDVAGLFDAYDFGSVWAAVSRIHRELSTRGLTPADLEPEPVPDINALYEEARDAFSAAGEAFVLHAGRLTSAAKHADSCGELCRQLVPAGQQQTEPEELAARLWAALCGYGGRGSAGAIRETVDELSEARARLVAGSVAVLTAGPARALVDLVARYHEAFTEMKAERGVLDFADLQLETVRLLDSRPALRERYRDEFRLVMIDEFQDTDELQMSIVRALSRDNLCTVGDERQSIYRFRGADLGVYRRHRAEMLDGGAADIELSENYRSHPDVIGFVNELFSSPGVFGSELLRLEARRAEPAEPFVTAEAPRISLDLVHAPGSAQSLPRRTEVEVLAERFAALRDAGVSPGDMVVLVRRYADAEPVAAALRRSGFSALVVGGRTFLDLPEVDMLRALCRVIANPRDDEALVALMLSPMSGVSDDGVWMLRNSEAARAAGRHLWDGLAVAAEALPRDDVAAAERLREVITRARARSGATPLTEVLMRAVEETGTDLLFLSEGDEGVQRLSNALRFAHKATEFERSGGAGAAAFAARIDAEERYGRRDGVATVEHDGSPAVRIMTVHASKGLEFPVVALPRLSMVPPSDRGIVRTRPSDGRLQVALCLSTEWGEKPEQRRTPLFNEIQEGEARERAEESKRLFYVACTRAREMLLLSGCANLEKPAEGPSRLALVRRSFEALLDAPTGTGDVRTLPDGTRVRLSVHEAPDGPSPAREPSAPEGTDDTRAYEPQPLPEAESGPGRAADGIRPGRVERLSYSDISLHGRCSLRFWAERVARLGGVPTPDGPERFGSALHAVLQLTAADGALPERQRIEAIAAYHRLDAHGLERLEHAARRYGASAAASELAGHERVRREYPFSVRMAGRRHAVDLVGAMDVYARSGASALIVDYKSGTGAASAEELTERYRSQAECYAYAALSQGCAEVCVAFVRPEVEAAGGAPEEVRFSFTGADAGALERTILEAHDAMEARPYRPLPAWDARTCPGCRVGGTLCPVTPPARVAG